MAMKQGVRGTASVSNLPGPSILEAAGREEQGKTLLSPSHSPFSFCSLPPCDTGDWTRWTQGLPQSVAALIF